MLFRRLRSTLTIYHVSPSIVRETHDVALTGHILLYLGEQLLFYGIIELIHGVFGNILAKLYEKDGGVIRYNHLTCLADTYIGKGGLNEIRNLEGMTNSVNYMKQKYPKYVRDKKCKSKYPEIRLVQKPPLTVVV